MTKQLFQILMLIILSSSCLNFGEYKDFEKNSNEAISRLKNQLKLDMKDSISEVNYFMDESGIDPYYVACFKTNHKVIDKTINQLQMTIDTTGKYVWIPENSPSWFAPPIDVKNNEYKTYIVERPGKKEFLYFDHENEMCFYANFSW